jgi:hypothetical protein
METGVAAGKDIDFAIAVFNDRRTEIRERIGYRDQWISRYVFGVVAFLGVSLGIDKLDSDSSILLCLVMPVVSWIVAINVSAHVRGVEDNANYIRGPVNVFLIARGAWVPHWDWKTAQDRHAANQDESRRNTRRRWANILSLHFPSLVSLAVAAVLLGKNYQFCACWAVPPLPPIMFVVACCFVMAAVRETWKSFDDRISKTVEAQTPAGWPGATAPPVAEETVTLAPGGGTAPTAPAPPAVKGA